MAQRLLQFGVGQRSICAADMQAPVSGPSAALRARSCALRLWPSLPMFLDCTHRDGDHAGVVTTTDSKTRVLYRDGASPQDEVPRKERMDDAAPCLHDGVFSRP